MRRCLSLIAGLALAVVVAVTGCSTQPGEPADPAGPGNDAGEDVGSDPDAGTSPWTGLWVLAQGHSPGGEIDPDALGDTATLTVPPLATEPISGSDGCNTLTFSLAPDAEPGSWPTQIASTRMACREQDWVQAGRLLAALEAATDAQVSDGDLVISGPGSEVRYEPVPPPPGVPHEAYGYWYLVQGTGPDGPVQIVADHAPTLFVTFSGVAGFAGCNGYALSQPDGADGSAWPNEVSIDEAGDCATLPQADRVEAQQQDLLTALAQIDDARFGPNELTLTGPDTDLRFERIDPGAH